MSSIDASTEGIRRILGWTATGWVLAVLVAGTLAGSAAAAAAPGSPVSIAVLADGADGTVIEFTIGSFSRQEVLIDGDAFAEIRLGSEPLILEEGAPELPHVRRSIIIPDDAAMVLNVREAKFYDVLDIDVTPSKGNLLRTVNPQDVRYVFGEAYRADAFYPGDLARLDEPYILRDHRGVVVEVNPLQYNPVTRTLRVYTHVTVEVVPAGLSTLNVPDRARRPKELSLAFHQIYENQFLNYSLGLRYAPLDETGTMLILGYDAWLSNVQALVSHRNAHGINTTAVGVSTIPGGNTATAIKNYIQSVYNSNDLAFVLLVGDSTQVATPIVSTSNGTGAGDPTYARVAGTDNYPDILVGRFSAETAAQVDTQVLRTIEYETMAATTQDWYWRGTGVASNLGTGDDGEYDNVHIGNIRTLLLAHGYTLVDAIYDPSATAAQVANALNAGRGIVNYCGHGSTTAWTSSGFSSSDVNALVNDNMLPFIFSVACVNGQFNGYTCFAEAWLRATHNGEPTGAIATYMSSINQSWSPPMEAQDHFNALLVDDTEPYHSFGTLCFAGSCSMIDAYGSGGADVFSTWHVFGDPAVRIVGPSGPQPPTAEGVRTSTTVHTPTTIGLPATDDGLPSPPAALDYLITQLPTHGTLTDPDGGVIGSVPYTLVGHGNEVLYSPLPCYRGADSLQFKANDGGTPPEGGDSNIATILIDVTAATGSKQLLMSFPLDTDPGWSRDDGWAFGQPTGGGTHNHDPGSGYTGDDVYGYNLAGDYADNMPARYLTTTALDCSDQIQTELRFRRWLGIEAATSGDRATVEVSDDGLNWQTLWQHTGGLIADTSWTLQTFDLSSVADGQSAVYIRWGMGPTDEGVTYPGWNIDDVGIWGYRVTGADFNGDNVVDLSDYSILEACLSGPGQTRLAGCDCVDLDGDEDVDMADFAAFQEDFSG